MTRSELRFIDNWYFYKEHNRYSIYNLKTHRENTTITISQNKINIMEWIKTKPPQKVYNQILEEIREEYGDDFEIRKQNWLED